MNKIKKWEFVISVIILFALFNITKWSLENKWFFEKKIPVDKYEDYLSNTAWSWTRLGTEWSFDKDYHYTEIIIEDDDLFFEGKWKIEERKLIIDGIRYFEGRRLDGYTEKYIKVLTKNYLIVNTVSPSTGGYEKPAKLKRIKDDE